MKKERERSTEEPKISGGPFLQPLALAGVCLVFVALLLTMAAMDFRTLDKTLVAYMEKRGFDFIRTVQQATGFNLQQMNNIQELDLGGTASTGLEDQRLSLQESMVMAILQLAQRVDHETGNGTLSHEKLVSLISRQGLWNLALFDDQGVPTFQKRPVTHTVENAISTMVRDHEDLKIHMFEPLNKRSSSRFVALRRKNNKGFVVLVFNPESFLFWKLRMAVEMAVDVVGMPANTDCFFIGDGAGLALFQAGACSEPPNERQEGVSGGRAFGTAVKR